MINTLKMALKIDLTYAINATVYRLKKLPILRDLLNDDVYAGSGLKKVARVLSILSSACRFILYRLFYFFSLYFISNKINPSNVTGTFIHIYFIFTIIGMFINNNVLSVNTKKYFSIILFNMDAKVFMKACFLWNLFLSFILNCVGFLTFSLFLDYSVFECFALILFSILGRIVGEAISVLFYKKNGYVLTANYKNTLVVLGVFLSISFLPYFNIIITDYIIYGICLLFLVMSIFSYKYLMNVRDYKLIYKKLNTLKAAMNQSETNNYYRQSMVQIKKKDEKIDETKIRNKKGYDLFNTIFFERHKEILMRSVKNYSLIALVLIIGIIGYGFYNREVFGSISDFILNRLGFCVLIMYFINRGSIVTQAMFYNCDHAMLSYNFYRQPDVIVNLFKKRLVMICKINLLPALVIGFGILMLLLINGNVMVINLITIPLFIIILSVFFSVHYLVLYYLLQPYNKNLEVKSYSYTFVSFITCIVCCSLSDLRISSLYFSIFGLIITIIYIIVAIRLVYKRAFYTFKIKG